MWMDCEEVQDVDYHFMKDDVTTLNFVCYCSWLTRYDTLKILSSQSLHMYIEECTTNGFSPQGPPPTTTCSSITVHSVANLLMSVKVCVVVSFLTVTRYRNTSD